MKAAAQAAAREALRLARAGRVDEALPFAERAVDGAQECLPAHGFLASLLLKLGRPHEAERIVAQAVELAPGGADAYDGLANVSMALGQHDRANALYQRATQLAPNDPRFWYNLACSERSLGKLIEAEAACDRGIALDPSQYPTYLLRSELRVQHSSANHIVELQAQLGRYYSAYEQLVNHWRAVLGDRMHEIIYEDLVSEPNRIGRAIATPAIDIQRNMSVSLTASASQVRRPIYGSSSGRLALLPQPPGAANKRIARSCSTGADLVASATLFADGNIGVRARPAAAQRFIERDEREGRVTFTLSECIVRRIQRSLRIENGQEALDASLVEKLCDLGRLGIRGRFRRELITTHFDAGVRDERSFDVPKRAQHRALIGGGRGGGAGRLRLHFETYFPGIEDAPRDAGADLIVAARGIPKRGEVEALEARRSSEGKVWIEICLRDADARIGGDNPPLRRANVRTALEELRGQPHRHLDGQLRNEMGYG